MKCLIIVIIFYHHVEYIATVCSLLYCDIAYARLMRNASIQYCQNQQQPATFLVRSTTRFKKRRLHAVIGNSETNKLLDLRHFQNHCIMMLQQHRLDSV